MTNLQRLKEAGNTVGPLAALGPTNPSRLRPLTSTVSILKMRIARMSSNSVLGSIYAGLMALADHYRHSCLLRHNRALWAGYVTKHVTKRLTFQPGQGGRGGGGRFLAGAFSAHPGPVLTRWRLFCKMTRLQSRQSLGERILDLIGLCSNCTSTASALRRVHASMSHPCDQMRSSSRL